MSAISLPIKALWRELMLFAVAACAHGFYARHSVKVPYVFGDEAGYLLKAAALTGHMTDAYSSYYPAYALLISPLFLLSKQPLAVFHDVQCLNALLAGIGAVLIYRLARRLAPARSPRQALLAALVVSFYPAFMAFAAFALSENLFVPLALGLALAVLDYARRPGRRAALLLGLLGGLLALTHPKGLVAAAAAFLAVLPVARQERRWSDVLLIAAVAALTFLPVWLALDAFFRLRLGQVSNAVDGHYPDAAGVLDLLKSIGSRRGLGEVLGNLLGQAFYLAVSSLGLAVLGFGWLGLRVSSRPADEQHRALRSYALYALLACLATMLMTALFMHKAERVDQHFYGRYDEGVLALLMLPSLLAPLRSRAWLGAAGLVLLSGLLVAWCYGNPLNGWLVEINIIGMQLWRALPGGAIGGGGLSALPIALATALLLLPLSRLARRSLALGTAVLALFLATSAAASYGYLRPTSKEHAQQHAIASYVKQNYPGVQCVNYDRQGGDYWARFNYQFFLLPLRLYETPASGSRGERPCSDLVISNAAGPAKAPAARLLLRERASSQALWQVSHP